jgi:hypothetical protein
MVKSIQRYSDENLDEILLVFVGIFHIKEIVEIMKADGYAFEILLENAYKK